MYKVLLFLMVFVEFSLLNAQEHAWVFLKDKPNAITSINNPLTILSQRALDRRARQNIALDETDAPIEVNYYNQISSTEGITVIAKSKWLNAIHVLGAEVTINDLHTSFDFIESIEFANKNIGVAAKAIVNIERNHQKKFKEIFTEFNYGNASNQIEMLNGQVLHENNFTGLGMQIAIIDAGFPNVNTMDAFARIRNNNQILGGYDFVDRSEEFYGAHNHGTHVLSDIAGYLENEFVGTAPDASFYLFRTEDANNETPLEETLWVEAAEKSDSLGVDVINTSLGYTTFDNSNYDYAYADMDGATTFISRGAKIASTKGMLLVTSAGNSGNSAWNYIGAPADVENVFSIGAVDANEDIASFSSFGPTYDGRIKPDVLAQGRNTAIISYTTDSPSLSNGTSFSSPIMAGLIACFWQAFPEKTNLEIMQMIRESADRYSNPSDQYGYGVPDFDLAFTSNLSSEGNIFQSLKIYPNPVSDIIFVEGLQDDTFVFKIYNSLGETLVLNHNINDEIKVSDLASGIYFLGIFSSGKQILKKFIVK